MTLRSLVFPAAVVVVAVLVFSALNFIDGNERDNSVSIKPVEQAETSIRVDAAPLNDTENDTETAMTLAEGDSSTQGQGAVLSSQSSDGQSLDDDTEIESSNQTTAPLNSENSVESQARETAEDNSISAVENNIPEANNIPEESPSALTEQAETEQADISRPEEAPLGLIIELSELMAEEQPRFGRIYVQNNGDISIIQGSGVPGTLLELLVNNQVAMQTYVGPSGNWSLYQTGLLSAGQQTLALRTSLADGRIGLSDETVGLLIDPNAQQTETKAAVLDDGSGGITVLSGPRFVSNLVPQILIFENSGLRILGKAPAGSQVSLILPGQDSLTGISELVGADGIWDMQLTSGDGEMITIVQESPVRGEEITRQNLILPARAQVDGVANVLRLGMDNRPVVFF